MLCLSVQLLAGGALDGSLRPCWLLVRVLNQTAQALNLKGFQVKQLMGSQMGELSQADLP